MINPPPSPELLAELAQFHDDVARLLEQSVDWDWRPAVNEWSLTEVTCHLRDVEQEVHLPRIRAILTDEDAFIPGVDADEWATARAYYLQDGRLAIREFLAAREETLALLNTLSAEAWQRRGQHTFFGPTSLQELMYLAVQHDRVHTQQIEALISPTPSQEP